MILPGLGLSEGDDTIQLARVLYTLGQQEDYSTLLMLGGVVMNRVDSPWFPDSVSEVIGEPHQFPHGMLYDDRSLQAAREIMRGRRALPKNVVYFIRTDAQYNAYEYDENITKYITSGDYIFYEMVWDFTD
jgi:N-acetylmuramoyl-L-alanine amidase